MRSRRPPAVCTERSPTIGSSVAKLRNVFFTVTPVALRELGNCDQASALAPPPARASPSASSTGTLLPAACEAAPAALSEAPLQSSSWERFSGGGVSFSGTKPSAVDGADPLAWPPIRAEGPPWLVDGGNGAGEGEARTGSGGPTSFERPSARESKRPAAEQTVRRRPDIGLACGPSSLASKDRKVFLIFQLSPSAAGRLFQFVDAVAPACPFTARGISEAPAPPNLCDKGMPVASSSSESSPPPPMAFRSWELRERKLPG
mmetsp:Transcript_98176/g.219068  ORF Transcript_98176/g.219068 Transcript_98176/m.219068 type:complete len:261 (-) Transcript_98176:1379-2161(-)